MTLQTTAPTEEAAPEYGNSINREFMAKISANIWTAMMEGFDWLSTQMAATNAYETTPVVTLNSRDTRPLKTTTENYYYYITTTSQTEISTKQNAGKIPSVASPYVNTESINNSVSNFTTESSNISKTSSLYPYYPAYYNMDGCRELNHSTDLLVDCEKPGSIYVFGGFVIILGLMAIFGNCVLPIVVWRRKHMRTRQNYIKVSLAFNDMIAGFILLFSVLPNIIWFRNSTQIEVIDAYRRTENSPTAILAGSSLIVSLQGSLYHLMYLSADRYIAIKWPLWNRVRRKWTAILTLIGIWTLTLIVTVITACYPTYFKFTYNIQVFMYTLGYNGKTDSLLHGLLHFGLVLLFPYVATIILTILTGAAAYKELRTFPASKRRYAYKGPTNRSENSSSVGESHETSITRNGSKKIEKIKKPEIAVAKTIIIMAGAFILAWSIFFVIFFLSYHGFKQSAEVTALVYMLSFYTGLSNSVANVIIYTLRDERFRDAVVATFCPRKSKALLDRTSLRTTSPENGTGTITHTARMRSSTRANS